MTDNEPTTKNESKLVKTKKKEKKNMLIPAKT